MKLGENMNLSKKEKRLFIILIGVLIIIFINSIILNPINNKLLDLKNQKNHIISLQNKSDTNPTKNNKKLDIAIKIEKELNSILYIKNINKNIELDENDNKNQILELNVSCKVQDIFKIEEKIKILGLNEKLQNIKIIKIPNIDGKSVDNYVDCTMVFKVE